MKRTFKPRIPATVGAVTFMTLTLEQLLELFGNPKFSFAGQRHHESGAAKRNHTAGILSDASLEFFGAYCEELGTYVNTDGYHRAFNLRTGRAAVKPGDTITLVVRRVKTVEELKSLYDKYNSAKSAKSSTDYMASGAREEGKIGLMNDPWLKSSAYSVQLAAGTRGTVETRDATQQLAEGLQLITSLRLQRSSHIKAGARAAMMAIAQHANDKALARSFITAVCTPSEWYPATQGIRETLILLYRDCLRTARTPEGVPFQSTGGGAARISMGLGLAAYYNYERVSRKLRRTSHTSMTLAQFVEEMNALRGHKAA
jgi:hypothetical protein